MQSGRLQIVYFNLGFFGESLVLSSSEVYLGMIWEESDLLFWVLPEVVCPQVSSNEKNRCRKQAKPRVRTLGSLAIYFRETSSGFSHVGISLKIEPFPHLEFWSAAVLGPQSHSCPICVQNTTDTVVRTTLRNDLSPEGIIRHLKILGPIRCAFRNNLLMSSGYTPEWG